MCVYEGKGHGEGKGVNTRAVCSSGASDIKGMFAYIQVFMTLFPKIGEPLPFLDCMKNSRFLHRVLNVPHALQLDTLHSCPMSSPSVPSTP